MIKTFPLNLAEDICMIRYTDDIELLSIAIESNLNQTLRKFNFSTEDIELVFDKYKAGYKISDIMKRTGRSRPYIKRRLIKVLFAISKKEVIDYLINGEEVYNKLEKLKKNRLAYLNSYSQVTSGITKEEAEELGKQDGRVVLNKLSALTVTCNIILPVRVWVIFTQAGIRTVDDLLKYSANDIRDFDGIKESDIKTIIDTLAAFSLKGKEVDEWIKNNS